MSARRKKPTLTVAELRRMIQAAKAEGCEEVVVTNSKETGGIMAVIMLKPRGEQDDGDEQLEGLE